MRASGNGKTQVCVENLLKTVRGEVPYERIKGLSREWVDQPIEKAKEELLADIEYIIETYEPRAAYDSTDFEVLAAQTGGYACKVKIENES